MSAQAKHFFEFGPFRADPLKRILLRDGAMVPLKPKVFEMLLVLVEARGQVLEKDELLRRVWPDSIVEESNLNVYVSLLRKALGESPNDRHYIVTIPGRGYSFVAEVQELQGESAELIVQQRARSSLTIEEESETDEADRTRSILPDARNEQAVVETVRERAVVTEKEKAARAPASAEILLNQIKRHKTGALVSLTALLIVVSALAYGIYRFAAPKPLGARFQRLKFTLLTTTGSVRSAAISPDGKYVVYVYVGGGIWLQQVATSENMQIVPPAVDGAYNNLSFSPDSDYIYYTVFKDRAFTLYQVATLGGAPRKLALGNVTSSVSFSPDGKRLTFIRGSANNLESELMVVNADGTNERRLAARKLPWGFRTPAWSPDGKVIACSVRNGPNDNFLEAIAVDGGKETPINTQHWDYLFNPAWLPDGSGLVILGANQTSVPQVWLIAYPTGEARQVTSELNGYAGGSLTADGRALVAERPGFRVNIWLAPGDSADGARQLTAGTVKGEGMYGLVWTPDGHLIYTSFPGDSIDLWIMDADGGNQKQLVANTGVNSHPAVTPDGRYVIFASPHAGAFALWRMDIDGGNRRQLAADGSMPTCSPDGRWIVYAAAGRLLKIGIDGGSPVPLTDFGATFPSISPNGQQIAFYSDGGASLGLIRFDGGPATKIAELPPSARSIPVGPHWTPDGRAIAYLDGRGGVKNIWSVPVSGGPPQQLTHFTSDGVHAFAWSRDGKWLALSRGKQTTDVVLISEVK